VSLWSALSRDYALFDFLPVSRRFRRDKAAYERVYLYTTSDGYDATYFVLFVLQAIEESVEAFDAWAWRRRGDVERVVRALGLPLAPARLRAMLRLPAWISVAVVRKLMKTEFAELALAGHAAAGGAEFLLLNQEFRRLIERASLPTPAIDELLGETRGGKRQKADTAGG